MEPSILAVRLKRLLENMIRTSSQESGRQGVLAGYLEERLRERLPPHLWPHLEREVSVPGLAREKKCTPRVHLYPRNHGFSFP